MTIDERLDRPVERHEALTQSVEPLTHDIDALRETAKLDGENIRLLAHIAEIHERRITAIEGGGEE